VCGIVGGCGGDWSEIVFGLEGLCCAVRLGCCVVGRAFVSKM